MFCFLSGPVFAWSGVVVSSTFFREGARASLGQDGRRSLFRSFPLPGPQPEYREGLNEGPEARAHLVRLHGDEFVVGLVQAIDGGLDILHKTGFDDVQGL